jgi:predicted MPP superfamily phosphohydrolase
MPIHIHCISDPHGGYDQLHIPPCDLLLITGDILHNKHGPSRRAIDARLQYTECKTKFFPWLQKQPFKQCVFIWGNHDFIGEQFDFTQEPVPDRVHFLSDTRIELTFHRRTISVFGVPWTPWFFDWAFNAPQNESFLSGEPFLTAKWDLCPAGTDVLLCHGPPWKHGDTTREGNPVGSHAFARAIERIKPSLAVFGHIHEGVGQYTLGPSILINASVVDAAYKLQNNGFTIGL